MLTYLPHIFFGLFVLSGLLLAVGRHRRDLLRKRNPPPGELINIGGRRLHAVMRGDRGPSVVILAGQGDFSLGWLRLADELARDFRVMVYDRAGLGWSDPGPADADLGAAVEDLHALLGAAQAAGPHILVGHSFGGMIARLYAHRYPAEVAGILFVDSAHEDQFEPEPVREALERMSKLMPVILGGMERFVRSGLAALAPRLIPDYGGMLSLLETEDRRVYRELLAARPEHIAAYAGEVRSLARSNDGMRAAGITGLGGLPIVVLMHGREQPQMGGPELTRVLEDTFKRLQAELAGLSPRGRLVVAEGSGHLIHLERPDLVLRYVRELAGDTRSPR